MKVIAFSTEDFLDVLFGIAQGLEIPDLRLPSESTGASAAAPSFFVDLVSTPFAGCKFVNFQDENAFCLFIHNEPLTYKA